MILYYQKIKQYINDYLSGVLNISNFEYEVQLKQFAQQYNLSMDNIKNLEHNFSLTKIDFIPHINKVRRIIKVYKKHDIIPFFLKCKLLKNIDLFPLIFELKIDGMMIVINYNNGVLESAITRGNLYSGENMLDIVKHIIPNNISIIDRLELRCEIFMSTITYNKYFANKFNSARHAMLSIVSNKKSSIEDYLKLNILVHDIDQNIKNIFLKQQTDIMCFLNKINLSYVPYVIVNNENDLNNFNIDLIDDKSILHDGYVVKINNLRLQNLLYESYSNEYRYSVAIKEIISFDSVVKNVIFQIGKENKIIPIIEIDLIKYGNLKCNNLSMYSMNFFLNERINIGSKIVVFFNGIFVYGYNNTNHEQYNGDLICPLCFHSFVIREKHGICENALCKNTIISIIKAFSKNIGINRMGTNTIEALCKMNIINEPEDILNTSVILEKYNQQLEQKNIKNFKKNIIYFCNTINLYIKKIKIYDCLFLMGVSRISYEKIKLICTNYKSNIMSFNFDNIKILNKLQINNLNLFFNNDKNKKRFLDLVNNFCN
ncbi:DNA ligase [bacterium AB1]|nr:DNA ligase [bacterium AB1]